eukprot:GEMP01113263.1.p2 GENE.GEMP01113263.1~~GEMP01113263.1.p2  ORF type:complete len:105 (-),score=9.21 GEMP01113263.1:132-446(-)
MSDTSVKDAKMETYFGNKVLSSKIKRHTSGSKQGGRGGAPRKINDKRQKTNDNRNQPGKTVFVVGLYHTVDLFFPTVVLGGDKKTGGRRKARIRTLRRFLPKSY